jgi:YegS/Rv2252/BmrU family lipid kinase
MSKKKVVFIINPHAGTGHYKKASYLLGKHLDTSRYDYELALTQYRGHGKMLAVQAVENKVDIVVAVGGDGTVNEIVQALTGTNVILGFIPTGSGNGLARHLQIPVRIAKAIQLINEGHSREIDTVKINGQLCVSIAGLGFDGFVAEVYDRSSRRGFFPYLYHVMKNYITYKPQTYIIEKEGRKEEHHVMLVSIANSSQWGFNVKISPEASMEDGCVDICTVRKPSLFRLPFTATALLTGNLHKDKKMVRIYRLSECAIYTKDNVPQPFHIDGDPVERQSKIFITVLPKSLRIITPKQNIE